MNYSVPFKGSVPAEAFATRKTGFGGTANWFYGLRVFSGSARDALSGRLLQPRVDHALAVKLDESFD